jgi:RHO protein GDP dissociation inhibitor
MPENESPASDARGGEPVGVFTLRTLVLDIEDHPSFTWRLDEARTLTELTTKPLVLTGGARYALSVGFTVGDAILSGLTYTATVHRAGAQVDVTSTPLGAYRPQAVDHRVRFPLDGWYEVPSGTPSSGDYTVRGTFTDDDGTALATLEYAFQIHPD